MRDQWYGDHRDLVKWGVLLHLARTYRVPKIIQVAYRRPDSTSPALISELGPAPIPPEVFGQFRRLERITELGVAAGVSIEVLPDVFEPRSRAEYRRFVLGRLRDVADSSVVLFLDPDTGISSSDRSPAHVTPGDLGVFWSALRPSDWLVVYQHASRQADWLEKRRKDFQGACPEARALAFTSSEGARDVALFAACRGIIGRS